jgi:2-keto-4-pentenoate hydratase/2-oxohepta-3-ene-1,7-dioic acid hydratase in catechol pathway
VPRARTPSCRWVPSSSPRTTSRIRRLIEYNSRVITLEPGDIIATGTPAGVGAFRDPPLFIGPGDRVRCEIEGIGAVENPVIDWADDVDDVDELEGDD